MGQSEAWTAPPMKQLFVTLTMLPSQRSGFDDSYQSTARFERARAGSSDPWMHVEQPGWVDMLEACLSLMESQVMFNLMILCCCLSGCFCLDRWQKANGSGPYAAGRQATRSFCFV